MPDRRIDRWLAAGVIDAATAGRIRAWENDQAPTHVGRFGRIALSFGGILLGAGVLLFVSANWNQLSPWGRFALLSATVAFLHLGGALVHSKSAALATTLHAVGTAALGGGIFLAGQVFNLAAHWPEGFLLWGAGAAVAAWLLRDWPQVVWVAILTPAWVFSEWVASDLFRLIPVGAPLAGLFLLSGAYVAAVGPDRDANWRRALAMLGGVTIVVFGVMLAVGSRLQRDNPAVNGDVLVTAWGLALVLPLLVGAWLRGRAAWPLLLLAVVAVCAAHLDSYVPRQLLMLQALYAAAAVGFVWWGVHEGHRLRINLGVLVFAMTVLSFYFSSLFDKLGRSIGLIGLGALFIGGGWMLERTRRRLVERSRGART